MARKKKKTATPSRPAAARPAADPTRAPAPSSSREAEDDDDETATEEDEQDDASAAAEAAEPEPAPAQAAPPAAAPETEEHEEPAEPEPGPAPRTTARPDTEEAEEPEAPRRPAPPSAGPAAGAGAPPSRRIIARKPPAQRGAEAPPAPPSAGASPAAPAAAAGRGLPARARLARPVRATAPAQAASGDRRARAARTAAEVGSPRIVIEDPNAGTTEPRRLTDLLHMRVLGSGGPGLSAMAAFTRKLSALITAGIPLVRSMKLLAERTTHPELRKATLAVARDVEGGRGLSEAMQKHPSIFDRIIISVVQVGEIGGILEDSLRRLSDILDRKSRVRKQVTAAATYPVVLSLMSIAAVVIIMMTVVPVFQESFDRGGVELPAATRFVIAISNHISSLWLLDLIVLGVAWWLFRVYTTASADGRRRWERIKLRLPLVGSIIRLLNSARFCRTLGGLLSAGIPLWESLGVAAETSESILVTDAVDHVRDAVERGQKLEPNLRDATCFTPEMLDIVGVGEEAGMLEQMMQAMADSYEDEVQARLASLIELLKPLLLFVVGGCIVAILVAVYLPYFEMIKLIGGAEY